MIEINGLCKTYGTQTALRDVNLQIGSGEIIGLFGENGAGKTTLMKCILGLVPYRGKIMLDGAPITRQNIGKLSFATNVHSFFPNLTPDAHRSFYQEHFQSFNARRYEGLMSFFELPKHKTLRHFSTGQQNQFEVIMALCQGANYILMDEPFAGNDVFNREDFYKVLLGILEPHETIILSTHLIEEISGLIGRAILIHAGQIVDDVLLTELDERGTSLIDHIKNTWHYRADRVGRALSDITGKEEFDA